MNRCEVTVVGAGPAGVAAALVLARAGVDVIVLERGERPGTKNVMGGILYPTEFEKLLPDFPKGAPIERPITQERFWLMDESTVVDLGVTAAEWKQHPHGFSVLRAKFDPWFAQQAKAAGALIVPNTTVTELLQDENGKVIGVRTNRPDGDLYADVVVLADGVNSLLAEQIGLHPRWKPDQVAVGVIQLFTLPEEEINQRFGIKSDEGLEIAAYGGATGGLMGQAFLYTDKSALSVGLGVLLSDLMEAQITPYQLLDRFIQHPAIAPLLEGAQRREYMAHLMPEGGYDAVPKLYGDGVVVVGDAAMFVNPFTRQGMNQAVFSGRTAAEAILQARQLGEYDARALSEYGERMRNSFVLQDLRQFREALPYLEQHPAFLRELLPLLTHGAKDLLSADGRPIGRKIDQLMQQAFAKQGRLGLARDAYGLWRRVR
ncbi:MAG: FAD-dependent oxidoreductase [Firmicutes bacterium]|nr:FAD-dependent oxidoreductase [Bacillota bacterium]